LTIRPQCSPAALIPSLRLVLVGQNKDVSKRVMIFFLIPTFAYKLLILYMFLGTLICLLSFFEFKQWLKQEAKALPLSAEERYSSVMR
jgi:hypothetical protein